MGSPLNYMDQMRESRNTTDREALRQSLDPEVKSFNVGLMIKQPPAISHAKQSPVREAVPAIQLPKTGVNLKESKKLPD